MSTINNANIVGDAMHTLSLALITKNEEENIQRLLKSVDGIFDEIVIADTGSTDNTKKMAHKYGPPGKTHIHDFTWIDDFSAARNFSFSKATSDYIMWLDADDEIMPTDKENLIILRQNLGNADMYLMPYNYAQDEFGHCTVKLFRHRIVRKGVATWHHPIHECMGFTPGSKEAVTNVWVTHRRSGTDAVRDKGRNIKILDRAMSKNPEDVRIKYYYAKELFSEGRLEECIKAFDKYFSGPAGWHDDQVNGHWYKAMALWQLGRDDEAINMCLQGMKLDPRFAEFYVIIGQIHYNKERWGQAIPWFELASRCKPPEAFGTVLTDNYTWVPHDRLCKCYSSVGKIVEAYQANEKALPYRPEDTRLKYNREFLRNMIYPGRQLEQPIRLSLGSGGKPTSGYRNSDLFPGHGIEEVFSQTEVPYPNSSVHAIHSEHALEHVGHNGAEKTIAEWARIMRCGGDLHLKVPDLELCCRAFTQVEDRAAKEGERFSPIDWFKYTIYGIQDVTNDPNPDGQYHKTGFTKNSLSRLLEKNGFKIDSMTNYDGWGTPSIEVRATMVGKPPRVAWLIPGKIDENHASLRIRCLNIHNWLAGHKVDSRLIEDYRNKPQLVDEIRFADVVVLIGFGPFEEELIYRLRRFGVSVIHDHCEDIDNLPQQYECFSAASVITCCSSVLANKAVKYGRTTVMSDAYEVQPVPKVHTYEPHGANGKIRVLWCGHGGNAANVDPLRPIIEKLGMELRIISEWDNADKKWNKDTWLDDMSDADIIVSPQRHWVQPAKSNTKVTQAMALGLPVLASPLLSYKEIIEHGKNGFICSTPEEWERDLRACSDQVLREKVGKAAKEAVADYSIDAIGKKWLDIITNLAVENCRPPAVDIVIPTWNNLKLLQECVKSIRKNTTWPHQMYVVNSGADGTKEWITQQPDIISINHDNRLHFSAANNIGLKAGKNQYVVLLNDDTIVARGWLQALMQEGMKPNMGAVNPFSNCDLNWLHQEIITVDNVSLYPGMHFDNVEAVIPKIHDIKHKKVVTNRPWVAFFGTLIPRAVIDKVGLLDEGFKSGCEDLDYCRRIKAIGYDIVTTYDSFIFHFGGSTRKRADALNSKLHQEEDAENNKYLESKYGTVAEPAVPAPQAPAPIQVAAAPYNIKPRGTKRFILYTGPAWETWTPKSLNEGGIGGSETCAVYLAKEFEKRGYDSHVFSACEDKAGDYDGVHYHKWQEVDKFLNMDVDLFVSSRRPEVFQLPIQAKRKICWVHDIWVHNDPKANIWQDKIDEFFCLSPWHRDFFCDHHKTPSNKIYVTRDAIDLNRFAKEVKRERGRMIYTSSPDRGLDVLLDILPRVRKVIPEANLHVFYGFHNWEAAVRVRKNQQEINWMENIKKKLLQPGVTFHGRVGQDQLAVEFLKSELWAYPTYFTETFCITAAEAMAAGLPVITTDLAALSTTVGDTGILLRADPRSEMYQDRFTQECIEMLNNRDKWNFYSQRSKAKAATYTWESLVDDWIKHLNL